MTSRLAIALAIPLLTSCVQPTTGPIAVAPESDMRDFTVRVVGAASAPRASGVGGVVDRVSGGAVTIVEGWAPAEDATLVVVVSTQATVIDRRRYIRPDAAAALREPGHPDLGFRLVLRSTGAPIERICVLAERAGTVVVLRNSDPLWCPAP